jgi:hypothetical protein
VDELIEASFSPASGYSWDVEIGDLNAHSTRNFLLVLIPNPKSYGGTGCVAARMRWMGLNLKVRCRLASNL